MTKHIRRQWCNFPLSHRHSRLWIRSIFSSPTTSLKLSLFTISTRTRKTSEKMKQKSSLMKMARSLSTRWSLGWQNPPNLSSKTTTKLGQRSISRKLQRSIGKWKKSGLKMPYKTKLMIKALLVVKKERIESFFFCYCVFSYFYVFRYEL